MSSSGGATASPGMFPGLALPGQRWAPLGAGLTASSAVLGNGSLRLMPCYLPPCTITGIGGEVSVIGDAGSLVRLGIYKDTGSGAPGAIELDAGTIAGDSATTQEIAVAHTFAGGWYWLGGACQLAPVTQPTVRIVGLPAIPQGFPILFSAGLPALGTVVNSYGQAGVAGALPANFAGAPGNLAAPRLWLRF